MKNLYKFEWDCGRFGSLVGIFLATKEEVYALIGCQVNFGSALGRNSVILGTIEEREIVLLTDNVEFLKNAEKRKISLESGCNPLHGYVCDECGIVKNPINKYS